MFDLIRSFGSRANLRRPQPRSAVIRVECLEDRLTPTGFVDNFESPTLDPFWREFGQSGSVTFPSTVNPHTGAQSVQFNTVNTANRRTSV